MVVVSAATVSGDCEQSERVRESGQRADSLLEGRGLVENLDGVVDRSELEAQHPEEQRHRPQYDDRASADHELASLRLEQIEDRRGRPTVVRRERHHRELGESRGASVALMAPEAAAHTA